MSKNRNDVIVMHHMCGNSSLLMPCSIPANRIQKACLVSEIIFRRFPLAEIFWRHNFIFLGGIFKIGDGYCLRRVFVHIYAKFQEVSMKTVGCETKKSTRTTTWVRLRDPPRGSKNFRAASRKAWGMEYMKIVFNKVEQLKENVFRSSWRISKSYSHCCSCGLFCFTAYSFHRNFLKLGIYM